jgi:hypothetical protein
MQVGRGWQMPSELGWLAGLAGWLAAKDSVVVRCHLYLESEGDLSWHTFCALID